MNLFIKNIIFKDFDIHKYKLEQGLEKINRVNENGENYCSITGTKDQINNYLEISANDLLSERLRTLNNLPKYRIINTTKERIN